MDYKRFSELWDALVANRPKTADVIPLPNGMTDNTAAALIEYSRDNKAAIESVRAFLSSKRLAA
jgi:hypothetical protein